MVKNFTLDHITSSAAVFNMEKLLWLNATYIKTAEPKNIVPHLETLLKTRHPELQIPGARLEEVLLAHRERSKTLLDIVDAAVMYLPGRREIDPAAASRFLIAETLPFLKRFHAQLSESAFTKDAIEGIFAALIAETGQKMAALAQPLRVALTGKTVSPGIYDVLRLLGKAEALARIDAAIRAIESGRVAPPS
jgi:glutamyl-tRNA synthetase